MFSTDDTIVAIATPAGRGGLGVVRLSGPEAARIAATLLNRARNLEPRRATVARIHASAVTPDDENGRVSDEVVATFFAAPHSYTGEDVVEMSAHGSSVVLRAIVSSAMAVGARLAEPGEFTFRAFTHGRIDLVQAEAVADLVEAVTPLQARSAFDQLEGTLSEAIEAVHAGLLAVTVELEASVDFPEEGYHFASSAAVAERLVAVRLPITALLRNARRGRLVREGAQVAILGKPNVGKSSLFNRLVGCGRAIVTDVPGTTRDLVTEAVDLQGLRVTLIDTAGIRRTTDVVEQEGVSRSVNAGGVADLVLVVLDSSQPLDAMDEEVLAITSGARRLLVINKTDLEPQWDPRGLVSEGQRVMVSLGNGDALGELVPAIVNALGGGESSRDTPAVSNVRHLALLERAEAALERAIAAAGREEGALSEEFVLADVQEARAALEEITGRRTAEEVLGEIFSRFCIGK